MTRKPKEEEPIPANQVDLQRMMQELLSHVFEQPLDARALGEMVTLSEHVTGALTPDLPADPWGRTPTEANPESFEAIREIEGHGSLEEATATSSSDIDLTPENLIKSKLLEFQIYLKYKLFGRAHHSLLEAQALARQASSDLESDADESSPNVPCENLPALENSMRGPEHYLTVIHRLLSLAESIEDTRVISLHAPNAPAWAGFVAHHSRVCFGVVIDGELAFDDVLKTDAPDLYEILRQVEGDNLLALQGNAAEAVSIQERKALVRQMGRAFLRLAELPARTPFRLKRTKVAEPGKTTTFSPADIYQEACAELSKRKEAHDEIYDQFESEADFSATFELLGRMTPCVLRCNDRLTMSQLTEFAVAADILAKTARRLSVTSNAQIIIPMNDHFWCCHVRGRLVGFSRYKMVLLGRVTGAWAAREAKEDSAQD